VSVVPVPQVSVFLDNRPGSLFEVMAHLDKNQIRLYALSIADAGEFGLVRMVTEDPERVAEILEGADFNLAKSKKNTEVTAILVSQDKPISQVTKVLGEHALNIEYAYSSAVHFDGKFVLVLRPKDVENAEKTLRENGVTILSLEEIRQHFQ
jgi:hypothetical protein